MSPSVCIGLALRFVFGDCICKEVTHRPRITVTACGHACEKGRASSDPAVSVNKRFASARRTSTKLQIVEDILQNSQGLWSGSMEWAFIDEQG